MFIVRNHVSHRLGIATATRHSRRPGVGRTSPIRPPAEALLGQMVRGGRSWPSDWNVGAGAERCGNDAPVNPTGSSRPGEVLGNGGVEHDAEQTLHLS
jgi:hypothetical protein